MTIATYVMGLNAKQVGRSYGDQAVQWLTHGGFNLNAPPTLILVTTALTNLINNSAAVKIDTIPSSSGAA
jgi:hypothetical protein